MARYERLSILDRFFIDMEKHNTHMHVAAVMILEGEPLRGADGGLDIERIRNYIGSRLHLIPRYRQRLAFIPIENHPVWVDDDRVNMHYHVRHTCLPKPGDIRQLKRLAARIMSQKLDRGKPLWEVWMIEGLRDGRCAMITKTHHCMIDGVSGVDLMTVLLSLTAETTLHDTPAWNPEPVPSSLELVRDELLRRATLPLAMLRGLGYAAQNPAQLCSQIGEGIDGLRQTMGMGVRGASDTPFNRNVGAHRRFDWATFDLADVKAIKNSVGGTVNDVVLATVAGAVGRFLELRGISFKQQERMDFRAFCPVSVRPESDRGRLGNQVSGMICRLPIAERDAPRRVSAIAETTAHVKDTNQALGAEVLTAVSEWTLPTLLSLGARVATRARAYNMIVTNVPGPQLPLYLLGAKLLAAFPLVPLFVNQALGVALFSYDGRLCWGFNADWDLVPDLHDFVVAMDRSFSELVEASGIRPAAAEHSGANGHDGEYAPEAAS